MKRIVLLACLMLSLILTLPLVAFAEAPAFSEGEFFEILEEAEALAVLYTDLEWSPQSPKIIPFFRISLRTRILTILYTMSKTGQGCA